MTNTLDRSRFAGREDGELMTRARELEATIAELRSRRRVSRETGQRRFEEMQERARERVAATLENLRHRAATVADVPIPAGLADAWLVATDDAFASAAHRAIEEAPITTDYGSFQYETDAEARAGLDVAREELDAIQAELALRSAEHELEAAERTVAERAKAAVRS